MIRFHERGNTEQEIILSDVYRKRLFNVGSKLNILGDSCGCLKFTNCIKVHSTHKPLTITTTVILLLLKCYHNILLSSMLFVCALQVLDGI